MTISTRGTLDEVYAETGVSLAESIYKQLGEEYDIFGELKCKITHETLRKTFIKMRHDRPVSINLQISKDMNWETYEEYDSIVGISWISLSSEKHSTYYDEDEKKSKYISPSGSIEDLKDENSIDFICN